MPKQNSSGDKGKLGGMSKQGDRYLRSLFTAGELTVDAIIIADNEKIARVNATFRILEQSKR